MNPLQEAIEAVLSYQWHGPREQLAALERLVTEARRVAQPAEPVAPMLQEQPSGDAWGDGYEEGYRAGLAEHAAPPAPQPAGRALTDEQLREIARNCGSSVANTLRSWWPECKEFARAIERAHGIKSEGE